MTGISLSMSVHIIFTEIKKEMALYKNGLKIGIIKTTCPNLKKNFISVLVHINLTYLHNVTTSLSVY